MATLVGNIKGAPGSAGTAGDNGALWWVGTTAGAPPDDTVGFDSDWFLDDETGSIFGPKAAGAWPATPQPNTLKGPDGIGLPEVWIGAAPPTPRDNYHVWVDTSQAVAGAVSPTYTQTLPVITVAANAVVNTDLTAVPLGEAVQINISGTLRVPPTQNVGIQVLDGATIVYAASTAMPSGAAAVIPMIVSCVHVFTAVPVLLVGAGNGTGSVTIDPGALLSAVVI